MCRSSATPFLNVYTFISQRQGLLKVKLEQTKGLRQDFWDTDEISVYVCEIRFKKRAFRTDCQLGKSVYVEISRLYCNILNILIQNPKDCTGTCVSMHAMHVCRCACFQIGLRSKQGQDEALSLTDTHINPFIRFKDSFVYFCVLLNIY